MNTQERLRALVDRLNKQTAKLPTGGDGRMVTEVLNTSAIARNQAMDRYKKGKTSKTLPLRELQLKR